MGLYEGIPYVNFHELNLNDLMAEVKKIKDTVDEWNGDIQTAVNNYLDNHPEIMITDNSVYTDAIQDGAVTREKLADGVMPEYVTPQMFKTADNTWRDAFQAAFDQGVDVYVPTDKGETYLIEGPPPVDVGGIEVVQPALIWRYNGINGSPRKLYGSATWRTVGSAGAIQFKPYSNAPYDEQPLIRVEQDVQGFHIANLRFTTTMLNNTGTCIDAATSTEVNKDIQITDCSFAEFWRVIDFSGRGLNVFNSIFGSCSYGVRVSWIPGATDSTIESRGIWFEGCRFHNISRLVVEVVSGHAWGLTINGCLLDNQGSGLVYNNGSDSSENWMICNNVFQDVNRASGYVDAIKFNAPANNCVIHNNIFHAQSYTRAHSHIVLFNSVATYCRISNNNVRHLFYDAGSHPNYRAFTFTDPGSHDNVITGNMVTGLEPTQFLCSTAAGCDRFLICDNLTDGGLRGGTAPTNSVVADNVTL